ncbi:hypothetical protein FSP39_012042 [Pinctada imbricata]|uniref:Carboxylesterase type B domain-containing protein n=1 Tax=Pinctada imbricata TaxID=66713 RepID=A0AA89C769_PINIB|nr:hypothetical protein FSP39_012042 [Pinctada imbricata]
MNDKYGVTSDVITDTISFVYTDWSDISLTPSNNTVFREIHDIVADTSFIVPTRLTARVHNQIQKSGSKTYLFRFSHRSSYSPAIPWIPGCSHGDEIPYVFGFPESMRKPYRYPELSNMPSTEMALSLAVMQFWTNFAKTGIACQLNIFKPVTSDSGASLPVMIWFYGGAYLIGQSDAYSGENLATYTGIVVVTVNYRIGPFGFLATDDDTAKGNYGLWDQHLASEMGSRKH